MPRRVLIIVNPAAGRMRSRRRRLDRVVGTLQRLGCPVTVRDAAGGPGMAEALARSAEPEFDVIVAAGGDGTVAAVVNGIAAAPRPVAILPFGTANVLAAEIGVPGDVEAQAAMIAAGPARPFWPGRLDGRLFVISAGAGFDAAVVAAVDPRVKRWGGRLAFAWASLVCLMRHRDRELTLKVDGVVQAGRSPRPVRSMPAAFRSRRRPGRRVPIWVSCCFRAAGGGQCCAAAPPCFSGGCRMPAGWRFSRPDRFRSPARSASRSRPTATSPRICH
jgi:Diacylglycerol kinase catalytic domain